MKRLINYVFVGTLGFAAGIFAHMLWLIPYQPSETKSFAPLIVSLCDLVNDPVRYDGKLVTVKGVLYSNHRGPYLFKDTCASPIAPSAVEVDVAALEAFSPLPKWATYSSFCGNDTYATIVDGLAADVVMTGTFKQPRLVPISMLQVSAASKQR